MKLTLMAFCFLIAPLVWGQPGGSVSGVIRDPQQSGIPFASVTLIARDGGFRNAATADSSGVYRFDRVVPGAYLITAAAQGFCDAAPGVVRIGKGSSLKFDVVLQVAGIATQIAVTASGTTQTADEMSRALSVVSAEEIVDRGADSIAGALREVPGLRVQQLGGPGASTSIKMRGLRNEDSAVLIDGFRLRDAAATQGDASGILSDLIVANLDRIEVLRGAGSSIYGSNATGGVVNIITNQAGDRTRGSVLLEGGSLGAFRGNAQVAGTLKPDRLQYTVGIAHLNVLDGVNADLPARTSSLQGRVDYVLSAKMRLFGRVYSSDSFSKLEDRARTVGSIPSSGAVDAVPLTDSEVRKYEAGAAVTQLDVAGATFIPAVRNPDYTRAGRMFSGVLSASFHPTESATITASYQGLRTRRRYGDGPAGVGRQPGGNTISYYDGEIHTANVRVDGRLGRYQSVNAGYEFENEDYANRSLQPPPAASFTVAVTQRSHALFVQDQLHLMDGRLQLAASYRAQMFSLGQPAAQTGDVSTAYFIRETGTKLRAHAGRGYRAPSLYERFGGTYSSSYGYTIYGDPNLRPEHSQAMDAGVDQTALGGRARVSATYFYTRLQQVIIFDSSGTGGRSAGYRNTNGGLARGVEFDALLMPIRSLTLRAAYTFTDARERTPLVPGVWQTYIIPDHAYSTSAAVRLSPRWTLVSGLAGSSDYLAAIYSPVTYASRAYRFSGAVCVHVGADYRLPVGEQAAVRFFSHADNVLNRTYFENGFRTPGATARSGIRFEF